MSYIAFAIISDFNLLFSICQVPSELGKICTFNSIIFKLYLLIQMIHEILQLIEQRNALWIDLFGKRTVLNIIIGR